MSWLEKIQGFERINALGKSSTPFLFIISYAQDKIFAEPLKDLDEDIFYTLGTKSNAQYKKNPIKYTLTKYPLAFEDYAQSLENILDEIRQGNSYLLNLTFKTRIESDASLKEIFDRADARYKLYYKDEFICFSPECFVEIQDNKISTYPMKGTIDASLENAKTRILENEKEMAEHIMITDLMRNDLGMIGSNIKVEKFRYVEEIKAGDKSLLQVSSKITARLKENWKETIGSMLAKMLPAGSITGTPKRSTVEIIDKIEKDKRGFYTGVFGIFDGKSLSSSVMIRFISKEENKLYYHSGGGITIDSNARSEYEELKDKIYLPI
ncbi:Para-aminobenzoate synthase, aminase component [hydrothermal vent metagenome]|uniref:Para-aminobenzoate synthase, aminase component n=1 Tax=hydrothermal vent metagenome TaxID=652676 RepID=A0A1W1CKY0_9ZZZZ